MTKAGDAGIDHVDGLDGAVNLLKALAAPVRLAVVTELAHGGRCVHELNDHLAGSGRLVSQPLLSQHLKVLREAGLVTATRRGQEICYTLVDAHVAHIVTDAVQHAHESLEQKQEQEQELDDHRNPPPPRSPRARPR